MGVLAGTSDPSEIGTSAASVTSVLSRGGPGMLVRPLSFLSISAKLVFALMRLLILGLKDDPSVSKFRRRLEVGEASSENTCFLSVL